MRHLFVAGTLAGTLALSTAPALAGTGFTPSATDGGLFGSTDPTYDGAFRQGLALLALARERTQPGVPTALARGADWLARQQCADGGWQPYRADPSTPCKPDPANYVDEDTNSTALAVAALAVLGRTPTHDPRPFLHATQQADGGWAFGRTGGSDPNSTGVVVQALLALHEDPATWTKNGKTPYDALRHFQLGCSAPAADRGAFTTPTGNGAPDVLATVQAEPATAHYVYGGALPTARYPDHPQPDCSPGASPAAQYGPQYANSWLADQLGTTGSVRVNGGVDYADTANAAIDLATTRSDELARSRAVHFLAAHADAATKSKGVFSPGQTALVVMAARLAAVDPRSFGGVDLVGRLLASQQAAPAPAPAAAAPAKALPFTGRPVRPLAVLAGGLLLVGGLLLRAGRRVR